MITNQAASVAGPVDGVVDPWERAAGVALHPSTGAPSADVLRAIAGGLAEVTVPWEIRTGEAPADRRYERLLVTADYDVWVIYWPPASGLDLHGHGGSSGAFAVVSGTIDERSVDGTGCVRHRRLTGGDSTSFGPGDLHAVTNQGELPVTSVHVYAPPLSQMEYFEIDDAGRPIVVAEDRGTWSAHVSGSSPDPA